MGLGVNMDENRPEPPADSSEKVRAAMLDLAVESWRLSRTYVRVLSKLDAGEQGRYKSSLFWYLKKLEENLEAAGYRLAHLEGQPYEPGIAASAINIQDFGPDDLLVVEQMLEPVIMGPEGVVRTGTVLLTKVQR
jgi:hypothetical protein